MKLSNRFLVVLFSLLAAFSFDHAVTATGAEVKIGILAQRGPEITLKRWNHLAAYLRQAIPEHDFVIVPLDFADISQAVADKQIDFLFVNSGLYVEMEYHFGIRPIATVRTRRGDQGISLFAGLIFTRADRTDIRSFQDLRNKSFMAVDRDSLGGWLMAKRELHLSGIDTEHDFKSFSFAGTHDGVVRAVLNGEVDAGTIRSDALERMVEDRLIDMNTLRVIHGDRVHFHFDIGEADFPYPHSTDIYPEWPMAKLSATSDELARTVAIALLRMSPDDDTGKSIGIMGWDIARNYQSVHDLYRELRIGPYRRIEHLHFSDVWQRYWPTIVTVVLFLVTLCVGLFVLFHLRMQLMRANQDITNMAMHDLLTQLPNRRLFKILADNAFAQARREGWKAYLFLIDLDGFKIVNDTYGHETGDEVLRRISRRLRQALPSQTTGDGLSFFPASNVGKGAAGLLRAEDLIARHGGDEFLGLLIHVKDVEAVKSIAQRVVDTLCLPMEISGKKIAVGASIGIAIFPEEGTTLEELIQKADKAMYMVKRSGKGNYCFFNQIPG